jgi:AmmeMemoRadiSam system protein B
MRTAQGSGRWYSANPSSLRGEVEGFLAQADVPAVSGRIVAALSPHAGYAYSGGVAGHTFRAIQEQAASGSRPDVVVVLGFTHALSFPGLALMDGEALVTPLGRVTLDVDAARLLASQSDRLVIDDRPHDVGPRGAEHSAENQVPFLQVVVPDVPLVIGLVGDHEEPTREAAVSALVALAEEKQVLVVSSTDLLHADDYGLVTRTDRETLERIGALDHAWLERSWSFQNQLCCGIGPVLAAMRFAEAQGATQGVVLTYQNSGDVVPEARDGYTVGYGAVVFPVSANPA